MDEQRERSLGEDSVVEGQDDWDAALQNQQDTTRERAKDVSKSIKWAHRMLWIDLIIYVVFLLSFLLGALVPFDSIAWDGHMLINIFTKYAHDLEWPDPANTFADIHSVADFWSWWQGPMRAILLGLDPYSSEDLNQDPQQREDHQLGYILNNLVVGTVRVRQQRVKLECHVDNVLDIPTFDKLCYNPNLWGHRANSDWAWPRFMPTVGGNVTIDDYDTVSYPFPPFAGDGTVKGTPLSEIQDLSPSEVAPVNISDVPSPVSNSSAQSFPAPDRSSTGDVLLVEQPLHQEGSEGETNSSDSQSSEDLPASAPSSIITGNSRRRLMLPRAVHLGDSKQQELSLAGLREHLLSGNHRRLQQDTQKSEEISSKVCKQAADLSHPLITAEQAWLRQLTPAFQFRSHEQLSEAYTTSRSALKYYDGSGYAHDFDVKNIAQFDNITSLLFNLAWIDAATRFIVVEFTLYSPSTDLVGTVFFMVEVHASGYAESSVGYEAFRLTYYENDVLSWGRLAVEIVFVILCVVTFATDLVPVVLKRNAFQRQQHWARNPFFWMSLVMMATTVAITAVRIKSISQLSKFDPKVVRDGADPFGRDYAKLHGPASLVHAERSLLALLSFCVWLRVFKYTRRVPVFGTIGRTLTRAFPAIIVFIAMSAVVFFGFAQSFFLGFYVSNEGYQSLEEALMSMVRFTSGDVNYDDLARTNTVLAPILYTLALFVLGFVWTSLLLAIVINAYYEEEESFGFDKDFMNYRVDNPLLREHKEWDNDAMTGENGSMLLTPDKYNRFVVNSIARFNRTKPMVSMTMRDFLIAARSKKKKRGGGVRSLDRADTLPLASSTAALSENLQREADAGDMENIITDSERIIVRFGVLKGVRQMLDVHALFFPIDMDEHRCRVWWEKHKHHLRVGDAAVRFIQQNVGPQQLRHLIVKTAVAPLRRSQTNSTSDGRQTLTGAVKSLSRLARRSTFMSRHSSVAGGGNSMLSGDLSMAESCMEAELQAVPSVRESCAGQKSFGLRRVSRTRGEVPGSPQAPKSPAVARGRSPGGSELEEESLSRGQERKDSEPSRPTATLLAAAGAHRWKEVNAARRQATGGPREDVSLVEMAARAAEEGARMPVSPELPVDTHAGPAVSMGAIPEVTEPLTDQFEATGPSVATGDHGDFSQFSEPHLGVQSTMSSLSTVPTDLARSPLSSAPAESYRYIPPAQHASSSTNPHDTDSSPYSRSSGFRPGQHARSRRQSH